MGNDWPGNVRELLHIIEQAIVLCDGDTIIPDNLPPSIHSRGSEAPGGGATLREVERRHVLSIVDQVRGNRAEAARILGISERNLYRLLRRYQEETASSMD